jgi:hypothetical protein
MSPPISPTSTRTYHVQGTCHVRTYEPSVRARYLGECIPSLVSNSRRKYCRYRLCAVPSYLLIATLTTIPTAGKRRTAAAHTVHPNSPYARMPPILLYPVELPLSEVLREFARISKTRAWKITENIEAE